MRVAFVLLFLLFTSGACSTPPVPPRAGGFWFPDEGRIVDLTRPARPGDEARRTTLTAPAAADPQGPTVDRVDPGRLFAPLVLIDVRTRAHDAPDFVFTADDLAEFEGRAGAIPDGAIVVLHTGGGSTVRVIGAEKGGTTQRHHPGFTSGCVELLVKQRHAPALGTDAPALDAANAEGEPARHAALLAGACVLTDLAGLDKVPNGRAIALLAPPLEPAQSAAVRVLALVTRHVGRSEPPAR